LGGAGGRRGAGGLLDLGRGLLDLCHRALLVLGAAPHFAIELARGLRQDLEELHGLRLQRRRPGPDSGDDHGHHERGGQHRRQPGAPPEPRDRRREEVAQEHRQGDGNQHGLRPMQREDHRDHGQRGERDAAHVERRGDLGRCFGMRVAAGMGIERHRSVRPAADT
jgi:hypothetical protein